MFFYGDDLLETVGGGKSGRQAVMLDFFALAALALLFVPDCIGPLPDASMRKHTTEQRENPKSLSAMTTSLSLL